MRCEIIGGMVIKEDPTQLVVVCWDLPDADEETRSSNMEYFAVVKSAIIELDEIKKGKRIIGNKRRNN